MTNIEGRFIVQMAWVVTNLDIAIERWRKAMGLGPFFVGRHLKWTDPIYRGEPSLADYSIAIAQAGSVQVELIEQHDDSPSVYRELVPAGGVGFHHVAILATDYAVEIANYEARGHQQVFYGRYGPIQVSFIDTVSAMGCMLEVIEETPYGQRIFETIRRAATDWDGKTDPVRDLHAAT